MFLDSETNSATYLVRYHYFLTLSECWCSGELIEFEPNRRNSRLSPSLYGVILMILALKQSVFLRRDLKERSGVKLVNILIRDQALYFLVSVYHQHFLPQSNIPSHISVIFVTVFSAINDILPVGVQALSIVGIVTSSPILSIIGSRLLFNMREMAEDEDEKGKNGGACDLKSARGGRGDGGDGVQISEVAFRVSDSRIPGRGVDSSGVEFESVVPEV